MASTYGWTHREIFELTIRQFLFYLEKIVVVKSGRQLDAIEASLFPHLKEDGRQKILGKYTMRRPSRESNNQEINDSWDFLRTGKWQSKA